MFKSLCSIALVALISGCAAPPQKTLAELDASLKKNEVESSRLYNGKSVPEVRQAAQQVLYLLDPNDMQFDVQSDSLLATRWSTYYAVFSVGFGRDWYSVDFEETTEGTTAKIGFTGSMSSGLFAFPIPASFKPKIPTSAHQNPSDFILFHDRIEFLLGLRDEWETCKSAKQKLPQHGGSMFLCDSLGLENKSPGSK
ncbi:hypothetical protein [Alcaligenes sp. SMD-FA]|uniref:hypothetical protein n=1 Tax=Alcaligenes sp. SMD-FA TaxID=2991054 RepID=UPI0022264BE2|nr:hypothetical protein [Alcaligenes sp. SMD-FA]UYY88093.1 hypothetical protein OKX01_04090 [Alcaligenes sp. SMD-FA]